jgi:hypothetical protein
MSVSAAADEPGSAMSEPPPPPEAPATARTGVAADTSANVSDADLAIGASVKDSAGMEIGKISKIGKSAGQTIVTLSANGKTTEVPASSLMKSGGVLVSSEVTAEPPPPN